LPVVVVPVTCAEGSSLSQWYNMPPAAPPRIGAIQNSQSGPIAQPPTKRAGPVERAGFTEVFVTGGSDCAIFVSLRHEPNFEMKASNVSRSGFLIPSLNVMTFSKIANFSSSREPMAWSAQAQLG
jgi:hypothetical protein